MYNNKILILKNSKNYSGWQMKMLNEQEYFNFAVYTVVLYLNL